MCSMRLTNWETLLEYWNYRIVKALNGLLWWIRLLTIGFAGRGHGAAEM